MDDIGTGGCPAESTGPNFNLVSFLAKIEKGVYVLAEVGSFDPRKYVKVVRPFNILLLPKLH